MLLTSARCAPQNAKCATSLTDRVSLLLSFDLITPDSYEGIVLHTPFSCPRQTGEEWGRRGGTGKCPLLLFEQNEMDRRIPQLLRIACCRVGAGDCVRRNEYNALMTMKELRKVTAYHVTVELPMMVD